MKPLEIFLVFAVFAIAIAYFLGRKRQIGFGWSLFFCFFLSPLIGFIIVMLSKKYYDENPRPSKSKIIIGWILLSLFILISITGIFAIFSEYAEESFINSLAMTIGFSGLGYYLIQLGKGKNFNAGALTKTE